jgi:WhiB family transcriptional regulator, redox-sensing transcriptional regulator
MKYPDFTSATCRGIGVDFFYQEHSTASSSEERKAKAICKECPVMQACLEWGIAHESFGIWGGTSPRERMKIRRKLGIEVEQILVNHYVNTK